MPETPEAAYQHYPYWTYISHLRAWKTVSDRLFNCSGEASHQLIGGNSFFRYNQKKYKTTTSSIPSWESVTFLTDHVLPLMTSIKPDIFQDANHIFKVVNTLISPLMVVVS